VTALAAEPITEAGFRHEAAVYRGDQGFLDVTVDYLRQGVNAGESVIVAAIVQKIELLRATLVTDADRIQFIDMAQAGRNPARIIPLWRAVVEASDGKPVRGIGEPAWHGRRQAEMAEALLHEALLNLAFADATPLRLRCPYDADALGPAIVWEAHRRHPLAVEASDRGGGVGFNPRQAAADFAAQLPEPGPGTSLYMVEFAHMPTVRRIRAMVTERARQLGIDPDRAADLALAVHEIAVNSLRHGGGSGTLRLWSDDHALICEISDRGHIDQPLVGRIQPLPTQLSGRGVWLANQLCDLVQIRSSAAGTTVRMHMAH
jgi:anti-sigma regulatory factor (Ser/Thr protein kinase)